MKKYLYHTLLAICCCTAAAAQAPCAPTENTVVVDLQFDAYPSETSWLLRVDGAVYGQGTNYAQDATGARDTFCLPEGCTEFELFDQYGDGMCCGFGEGAYTVWLNGSVVASGGEFDDLVQHTFNCPPGTTCEAALPLAADTLWTVPDRTWVAFSPAATGNYLLSSCDLDNACPTTIWVYDYCTGLVNDASNIGTVYYNNGACGNQSALTAVFEAGALYYLLVGSLPDCAQDSVGWLLQYQGPVAGCTDPEGCNYNPLATVSDGSCVYAGHPDCADGPDLALDEQAFLNSLYIDALESIDDCMIQEGCLGGYGTRELLRFDTRILNVGNQDYYIGAPPAGSGGGSDSEAWEWDLCHGHWHYEGYAEYLVYDTAGNELPLGFKNGFCVMDIECAGGGTAKYSCGNQGITAGCGDIYNAGLPCQWFDITDLAAGTYTFVVRTNWNQAPDALGRTELSYANNWMQACLDITRDPLTNAASFGVAGACELYVDCAGEVLGTAVADCSGACDGTRLTGDLNQDALRDQADVFAYFERALAAPAAPTACDDLDGDGRYTVADLALLIECSLHGGQPPLPGHAHSPCEFPFSIQNPYDTVRYEILELNAAAGYADLGIHPQSVPVGAFQLTLSGVALTGVTAAVEDYTAEWRHDDQTVVVASLSEDVVAKSTAPKALCRLHFAPADSVALCFEEIITMNAVRERAVSVLGNCAADQVTNVRRPATTGSLAVYPNPADGRLHVLFDNPTGAPRTLELLGAAGQVLRTTRTRTAQWQLDTRPLPNGVYYLRLTGSGAARHARVVVAH